MKIFRRIFLILFLSIILAYVTNITSIPDSVLLFKGEKLELGTMFGIYIRENDKVDETIETSSFLNDLEKVEKSTVQIALFNIIPVKEVNVNTIPNTTVIPLGNVIRT